MLNVITICLNYIILSTTRLLTHNYMESINGENHNSLRRSPMSKGSVPVMMPEVENSKQKQKIPDSINHLNLTDLELSNLQNMYNNDKDLMKREQENQKGSAGMGAGDGGMAGGMAGGDGSGDGSGMGASGIAGAGADAIMGGSGEIKKNINDFNENDASNLQAAVNNPTISLEGLQDQIKNLRVAAPSVIKKIEDEALGKFYETNPDAEPAEALLAAQKTVEGAENEFKIREQQLMHQMDAIKDNIRVSEASKEAGRIFAENHPQAKESELLKAQYEVAQETQMQINDERDKQAISEAESQKVFNEAMEAGALQADASKVAEIEKEKIQNEMNGGIPFNPESSFNEFNKSSISGMDKPFSGGIDKFGDGFGGADGFSKAASLGAAVSDGFGKAGSLSGALKGIPDGFGGFEKPIKGFNSEIIDDQVFIQDRLPNKFLNRKEELDMLSKKKMEEGKEAEDMLNDYIQEEVNKKGFPLKDFLEESFSTVKNGGDPWTPLEKYLSPFPNSNMFEAFTGVRNSFPEFGNSLLNRGMANSKPNSELIQTLAQQNIGQQFGLTEEERNSLLKQGRSPQEIEEMNEQIITENRLTNNELLDSYNQNMQSGKIYDDMVNKRMEILERINKNPTTDTIDDRIKRNDQLKQKMGMSTLPILSQEAQEKGDEVYEEILNQTGDHDFAKQMAQKSAMAFENRMNEEQAFIDSKKASADIFEATNVIEEAKEFISKEDAKTIKEAQKVKHMEPGLMDAERARRETESAEAIQQEIEKLRVLEMEHKVQAEELAIQSNLKNKKAQQLEELSHATDIMQTEEILGQERDDRMKNLGIKKVLEDDETEMALKNASINFPLKTFGEVEAADEEEYKIMQGQEELKEDLKNTVTEAHFDSPLNVIKTEDGFLNVGENASEIEIAEGEVIFPFSAEQEMKKRGIDTDLLEKRTNKGEQRNMATGIVYYAAPITGGKFPLPRPLNPTPSHVISNANGEQIDTLFAQSMSVFDGKLNLEPMSSYKNNVRPRVNKPLNVEKALSVEQQTALEELKQRADEIEQTQVQVFENPDGTRVVKLIKPFGEASTMSTEKAIEKDEGIHVQDDFVSFNVADLEDGPKISDDLTLQVFEEALAEGKIEDANFVSQFLKEHGGSEELISKLEEQTGFEGMEQVIETKGEGAMKAGEASESSQSGGSSQSQSGGSSQSQSGSSSHSQSGGSSQSQSGSSSQSQSGSSSQSQSGSSSQSQSGGSSHSQSGGSSHSQSGGSSHSQSGGSSQSQSGSSSQSTEIFGGTKVNKTTKPPSMENSSKGNTNTMSTMKSTSVVTYGNQTSPQMKKPESKQTIKVEETIKPDENTEIKRKIVFDNNAKIGDIAKKFDPSQGIPGLSKEASNAFKDLNDNATELEKKYNVPEGTIRNVIDELPIKVFQEFEENMKNLGMGDPTLHPNDPTLPFNDPVNNPKNEEVTNPSPLTDPSKPVSHPTNQLNKPSKHKESLEILNALDGGVNTSKIEDLLYDTLSKYNHKPNPKKIKEPTMPTISNIENMGDGKLKITMKPPKQGMNKIDPKIGMKVGKKSKDKNGKPCTYDLTGTCVPNNEFNNQNIIVNNRVLRPLKKRDQTPVPAINKPVPETPGPEAPSSSHDIMPISELGPTLNPPSPAAPPSQ